MWPTSRDGTWQAVVVCQAPLAGEPRRSWWQMVLHGPSVLVCGAVLRPGKSCPHLYLDEMGQIWWIRPMDRSWEVGDPPPMEKRWPPDRPLPAWVREL